MLGTLVSQREALKRDLDEAFERLSVAEQLVQGREKERDDVLMSYRALNDEKVRAEASLERCSSECHQLRAQVPGLSKCRCIWSSGLKPPTNSKLNAYPFVIHCAPFQESKSNATEVFIAGLYSRRGTAAAAGDRRSS